MSKRNPQLVKHLRGHLEDLAVPSGCMDHVAHRWVGAYSLGPGLCAVVSAMDEVDGQRNGWVRMDLVAPAGCWHLVQQGLRGERTERGLVRIACRALRHVQGLEGPGAHLRIEDPNQRELFPAVRAADGTLQ